MSELEALLFAIALVAGLVDSIAGGGGLLTVPALLWTGLPPVEALATNKLQASFGSFIATVNFMRQGAVDLRLSRFSVACTFVGASVGALLVQVMSPELLERVIPFLLIGCAFYLLRSPRTADADSHRRISDRAFALGIGTTVGFYDGFFGPGTGTFFAAAYLVLLGYNLRRATAHTKLLNFTSNLASLCWFAIGGYVVWRTGLIMAAGQFIGAWTGSHLVLRHGGRLVRPLLVVVTLAISLRLLLD